MKKPLSSPPMGWNSWDCYGAAVSEEQLLINAEYMRDNLKEYGYEYVVCDIQWYEPKAKSHAYNKFTELCMDEYSRLIPAENRFPSSKGGKGFKPIADKIHAMGLKFGIHIMRGIPRQAVHMNTKIMCGGVTARDIAQPFSVCAWNTDMYGVDANIRGAQEYYNSIFELYASWGVDFIKCDDIANTEFKPHDPYSARAEIEMIRKAIENCGRDMVLSLSPGPAPVSEHEHLNRYADMWRISGDFWDGWDRLLHMFELCKSWMPYKKRGAYPDCDMLPVGKLCLCSDGGRQTRFSENEQITMLTLWSIFTSPLFIGAAMQYNDDFTLRLLTNKDIIEMDQTSYDTRELWRDERGALIKAMGSNCEYYALFNFEETPKEMSFETDKASAYEMWSGESIKTQGGKITVTVEPHCAKAFRVVDS
ncbi:MAG: alpha-galactosidase [Acutalibacteraceae bacterium]